MPLPLKRLMTKPRSVLSLPPLARRSPATLVPRPPPLSSIKGAPLKPGWLQASIKTAPLIVGRAVLTLRVCTPGPAMLKVIRS